MASSNSKNVSGEGKKASAAEAKKKDAKKVKYTGAVLGMLVFFGVLIAVVDAVIVPVLYAYQGLR